ncbi:MAG: hypothetical protein QXW70_02275 [Candidatus Anstonellales archaeon]
MYNPKELKFNTVEEAANAIKEIDVSDACVKIMAPKAVFVCIKLHNVRNAVANILKQEMIAEGGDATVSQYTVNCAKEKTDVLLMGTIAQFTKLQAKMRMQGYYMGEKRSEYEGIVDDIDQIIKNKKYKL